jgi:sugar phosphate permease
VTGVLIDRTGWSAAFLFWGGASLVGALLAIPLWNTRGGSAKISH